MDEEAQIIPGIAVPDARGYARLSPIKAADSVSQITVEGSNAGNRQNAPPGIENAFDRFAPAHPVFSSADNIALITRGGGYQTTDVHVEVFRQSDGKRVYSGTHADTPNGKLHFWTLKLPPGKYTARSFIGPVETQVFDFLVLP